MSASSLPEWKEDGPKSRQLWVNIIAGRNLKAADSNGFSDPYVRVFTTTTPKKHRGKCDTKAKKKTLNPTWEQGFFLNVTSPGEKLYFEVYDEDLISDDLIGKAVCSLDNLFSNHETKFWLPLSTQGEIQIGLLPKFWTTGVVPEGRSIEEAFMLANGIELPAIQTNKAVVVEDSGKKVDDKGEGFVEEEEYEDEEFEGDEFDEEFDDEFDPEEGDEEESEEEGEPDLTSPVVPPTTHYRRNPPPPKPGQRNMKKVSGTSYYVYTPPNQFTVMSKPKQKVVDRNGREVKGKMVKNGKVTTKRF